MNSFAVSPDWLAVRAAASPAALALIVDDRELTYDELDALVSAMGRWLRQSGVQASDHIGVLLPNCLAYAVVIHALTRLDAVLVPLNTRLSAGEVDTQIQQAGCTALIASRGDRVALSLAASGIHVISIDRELIDLEFTAEAALGPVIEPGLDRLQAILFTSGTTGRPKGAMLTYSNHFHSAVASAFRLGVVPTDRWLACLPLYHVGGLAILLRACLYGTAVVLHDGFDVERVDRSLMTQGITLVSLVPTMLYRLMDRASADRWPALRLILLGGAPASEPLLAEATAVGLQVATTYGLTEAASQVATQPPDQTRRKPGSVGQPLLFTRVRVADDEGATLVAGEIGEVCVSGPTVFAGYYGDEAATKEALRQGELRTGDLGYLDEDGALWLVQRRSDLIITGGENVYPAEVEHHLSAHPTVAAVCVVGLPDREWGQQVAALVVATQPVTAETLIAHARRHLAAYKVPRFIHFADTLPLTGSGKVSRPDVVAILQMEREPTT